MNFVFSSKPFSSQTLNDFKQTIEFPFAAFGLLLDNCLLLGATEIAIQFEKDVHGLYVIKVEDNGKMNWDEEEFEMNLTAFCSQAQLMLMGCDKKVKKAIVKSNQVKDYGANLKLGCSRLGKRFLAISYSGELLRVHLYYEDSATDDFEDRQLLVRYYAWSEKSRELVDPGMGGNQEFIEHEYRKYIREVLASKTSKNVVYIFDTVIEDEEEELTCKPELNDIYLGSSEQIDQLKKHGFSLNDSIDISLKAYLSAAYLKNDYFSIQIGFGSSLTNINLQHSLEQVDRLCKLGNAVELEGVVEFDFKFAEFYYLREITFHSNASLK
jgi:hypothetical protein